MQWTTYALAVLLSGVTCGCSSSDDNESSSAGAGGSATETACAEIDALCHDADDGSGDLAEECHHLGHVDNEAECTVRYEECMTFCAEKLEQNGGHGHGHGGAGGQGSSHGHGS